MLACVVPGANFSSRGSKFILARKYMGTPPSFLLAHCQPQPCIWSSIVFITLLNEFSGHVSWSYKSMYMVKLSIYRYVQLQR